MRIIKETFQVAEKKNDYETIDKLTKKLKVLQELKINRVIKLIL